MALANIVEILKQLKSRKVATRLDDARKARIIDIAFVPSATFTAKTQVNVGSLNLGMPIAQGRQAEAAVGLGIFAVAYAKRRQFQKPDNRGEHPLAWETVATQIRVDASPDQRQDAGKHQRLAVFGLVADFAPERMVTILLAPSLVSPGNLDVSEWVRIDPYRRPCRWNHQGLDTLQGFDVAHQCTGGLTIIKARTSFMPRDSRSVVGRVVQLGELGRSLRVQRCGRRRSFRPPSTSIHFRGLARLLAPFRLAGLGHGNRDGLLAAFHLAARAALEVSFLVFVHYLLDFAFL